MGIYNRDYYREDMRGWSSQWLVPGCKWLIIATVAVFLLQVFVPQFDAWMSLDPNEALRGQVWRLLTYAFLHSQNNLLHLIFNMLMLGMFGAALERIYGTREFVLFYLASAIAAGALFVALGLALGDHASAVGASGAVMALMMLYALHFPRQEIFLFGLIRVQVRYLVMFYIAFDLLPVVQAFGGASQHDGIAHTAHLGGLAFGFLYHRFHWKLDRLPDFRRLKPGRILQRRKLHVYQPPDPDDTADLNDTVDRILQKIHDSGESSLTEKERATLRRASEQYKQRR